MNLTNLQERIEYVDKGFRKRIIFEDEQVLCILVTVKVGQEMFAHRHEKSALTFTVLNGKGEVTVNGEKYNIQTGSTGVVKGTDKIGFQNVEENLAAFVTLSPKPQNPAFLNEFG